MVGHTAGAAGVLTEKLLKVLLSRMLIQNLRSYVCYALKLACACVCGVQGSGVVSMSIRNIQVPAARAPAYAGTK